MSDLPSSEPRMVRFGLFELDLRSGELRKSGVRIGLQDQPLQVLSLLLEHPGELVTRDELRQVLWPSETFVDFEHGLNAATKRLRDALGDSANAPRFIETRPRRGYRFIAPVEFSDRIALPRGQRTLRSVSSRSTVDLSRAAQLLRRKPRFAAALAAAVVIAAFGTFAWYVWRQRPTAAAPVLASLPAMHSVVELPPDAPLSLGAEFPAIGVNGPLVAISRDGTHIVYVGRSGAQTKLFVRATAGKDVRPIPGTEGAIHPFFSPNGRWVGFLTNDKVKKVSLDGGMPVTLCSVMEPLKATWTRDDVIYVAAHEGYELFRVHARGGIAELVKGRSVAPNETGPVRLRRHDLTFDQVTPDGKWAFASVKPHSISKDYGDVLLLSLGSRETKVLLRSAYDARYVPPGYLLFARTGNLLAVRFDAERREVSGEPVLVASGVSMESLWGQAQAVVSDNGLLLYVEGGDRAVGRLAWVDRGGNSEVLDVPARVYGFFHVSPTGDRVAVHVADVTDYVWIYDLRRREGRKLAVAENSGWPVWNPDAVRIALSSWRVYGGGEPWTLSVRAVDGNAAQRAVLFKNGPLLPASWSPDGRVLAVDVIREGAAFVPVTGEVTRAGPPIYPGVFPYFSPTGRWVAYQTFETGQGQVWVRSYPDGQIARQISTDGGIEPVWCATGELFYRNGNRWMSTIVSEQPALAWQPPRQVFDTDFIDTPGISYDVSRDGRRLLVLKPVERGTPTKLHLVSNWAAALDHDRGGRR